MVFLFLIVPVLFFAVMWFVVKPESDARSLKFFLISGACSLCLTVVVFYAAQDFRNMDTEIVNGKVIDKDRDVVPCSHSYSCNCYTTTSCSGSGKSRSCSTTRHCSICHEHAFDVDWDVKTTVGGLTIDRIDRQGIVEPPRWTAVKIGEPASMERSYMNYILGNKDSLFSKSDVQFAEKFKKDIPAYPRVHDYYRVSRVLNQTSFELPTDYWNKLLNERLETLGPEKQVNIVWVITSGQPIEYFRGLQYAWSGAKKNDVIIVTDIDKDNNINWGNSTSYADGMNNMQLHATDLSDLTGQKLTPELMLKITNNISDQFKRVSMKDMEYIKNTNLSWFTIIAVIISSIAPTAVASYIIKRK